MILAAFRRMRIPEIVTLLIVIALPAISQKKKMDTLAVDALYQQGIRWLQKGDLAAARAALDIHEYAPRLIKQTVVGYGNAEKHQVQEMVRVLLSLKSAPQPHDAADALAVAICHFHHAGFKKRIQLADARLKTSSSIATHRRASR